MSESVSDFIGGIAQLVNPVNLVKVITAGTKGAVGAVDKIVNPDDYAKPDTTNNSKQSDKQSKQVQQIQTDVNERRRAKQERLLDTNTIRPYIRQPIGREYEDAKITYIKKQKTKQQLEQENEYLRRNIMYDDVQAFPLSNQYLGNTNMLTTGRRMATVPSIQSSNNLIKEARKAEVGMKTNTGFN